MEHLELICSTTGEGLGVAVPRHAALRAQVWCRSTNIYVLNHKGEILVHQRSMEKERMPGVWVTHLGGHVGEGETYESNALKELEEEAGIKVDEKQLVPWRTTRIDKARLWTREFVTVHDAEVDKLVAQPGEVDRFAWMSPEEILKASHAEPHMWQAGTHDFRNEYYCLRSAIITAHSLGAMEIPSHMGTWNPVTV